MGGWPGFGMNLRPIAAHSPCQARWTGAASSRLRINDRNRVIWMGACARPEG